MRGLRRGALAAGYALGAAGYGAGLLASALLDLPSGPVIAWALATAAIPVAAWPRRRATRAAAA